MRSLLVLVVAVAMVDSSRGQQPSDPKTVDLAKVEKKVTDLKERYDKAADKADLKKEAAKLLMTEALPGLVKSGDTSLRGQYELLTAAERGHWAAHRSRNRPAMDAADEALKKARTDVEKSSKEWRDRALAVSRIVDLVDDPEVLTKAVAEIDAWLGRPAPKRVDAATDPLGRASYLAYGEVKTVLERVRDDVRVRLRKK